MTELFNSFTNYAITLPWLELIAMLLALAYVIFAAQGSIWCWPAAFISTALYTIIFYDVSLLMESLLNVYYLIMAVYGYYLWQKNNRPEDNQQQSFLVTSWSGACHLKICAILTVISAGLGYVMATYTHADFPYIDTFTTIFAVFATYLVTQKVLQNWLYWLVIDFVSIYLYIEKALHPTAFLFMIYLLIAAYGYVKWRGLYNKAGVVN